MFDAFVNDAHLIWLSLCLCVLFALPHIAHASFQLFRCECAFSHREFCSCEIWTIQTLQSVIAFPAPSKDGSAVSAIQFTARTPVLGVVSFFACSHCTTEIEVMPAWWGNHMENIHWNCHLFEQKIHWFLPQKSERIKIRKEQHYTSNFRCFFLFVSFLPLSCVD